MLTPDQISELHRLHWVEKWSLRKIARHLRIGRCTIAKYLEAPAPKPAHRERARKIDPWKQQRCCRFHISTVVAREGCGNLALVPFIGRGSDPIMVRKWFTIAGFSIACTELIGAQSSSVPVALTFSVVSLSGLGLATANYWALTQTLIPASAIGRVSGIQNCAGSVAGIAAPIFTGWLKQQTGSYEAPMFACCAFLLVGVLSYLFMVKEQYAPGVGD